MGKYKGAGNKTELKGKYNKHARNWHVQNYIVYQDASSRSPRLKIFIQFSTYQIYVKYNTSKYHSVPPYKEKKSHSSPLVMAGLNEQLVDEEKPLDEDN